LKNALDWTVSSGDLVNKPVALITAASGGKNAHASLLLTLSALSASVSEEATLIIPFIRAKLNERGEFKDETTLVRVKEVISSFVRILAEKNA
jgi:chromate reductase